MSNLWVPQDESSSERFTTSAASTANGCSFVDIKEAMQKMHELKATFEKPLFTLPIQQSSVISPYLTERVQIRFPRSKKKRIRKKWARDPKNFRDVPREYAYIIDEVMYMHPDTLARLQKVVSQQANDALVQKVFGDT